MAGTWEVDWGDIHDASSVVLAGLRDRILKGDLAPGMALNQESLAEDFGVSRMPIRQALKRLQAEGLVQPSEGRRLRVARLHRSEIEDIFDMRLVLEPLALRLAIPATGPLELRQIKRALEDMNEEPDPAKFGLRNTEYHLALCAPCGRRRLLAELRALLDLSDRYQRAALSDGVFTDSLQVEHVAMFEAVSDGDPERAVAIVEGHLRSGRDRLLELFSVEDSEPAAS